MLKHTLVLIAVLSLAVVTRTTLHAQTTDFSGTWTLDQEASQFPQPPAVVVAVAVGVAVADKGVVVVDSAPAPRSSSPRPRLYCRWSSRQAVRAGRSSIGWTAASQPAWLVVVR